MSGTGLQTRGLGLEEGWGAGGAALMGLETHATTETVVWHGSPEPWA